MRNSLRVVLHAWIALAMYALCSQSADAQLAGEISRIVVRQSSIKVEFNVQCGGIRYGALTGNDVTASHDSISLPFQGWRCTSEDLRPFSTVLLLDASEATGGIAANIIQAGSRALIDSMDGAVDEASVMLYNQSSTVVQQMTSIKPMLYSALNQWSGARKRYSLNALQHAVQEVSTMASHNATAVIHVVTGGDEGSSVAYGALLDLALSRGVRIYSIALNAPNTDVYRSLSEATGGSFAMVSDSLGIALTINDICRMLRVAAADCSLILAIPCTDGEEHDVSLSIAACNSTIDLPAEYVAPSTGVEPEELSFSLADCSVAGLDTVLVPLRLNTIPKYGVLYPLQIGVGFDPAKVTVIGATTPPGTLFDGVTMTQTSAYNRRTFSLPDRMAIADSGVCMYIVAVAKGFLQPASTDLYSNGTRMLDGCGAPVLSSGRLGIYPNGTHSILDLLSGGMSPWSTTLRFYAACERAPITSIDSAALLITVDDVPQPHRKLEKLSESGVWEVRLDYGCSDGELHGWKVTLNGACAAPLQDTLTLRAQMVRFPIQVIGPSFLCAGDSTILDAGGGFSAYRWSTGETTRSIVVRKPDIYVVAADNGPDRCPTRFDPIVIHGPIKPRVQPPGVIEVCNGAGVQLSLPQQYASYRWSNGSVSADITVYTPGEYYATVVDVNGCVVQSDTVLLVASQTLHPVITPSDSAGCCEGAGVVLDAGGPYLRYLWSNGYGGRRVLVNQPGQYLVQVWNASGCTGVSAPVLVHSLPNPKPRLLVGGSLDVCEGDSVRLSLEGYDGSVLWSSGDTTREIVVKTAGEYWLRLQHENGCVAYSDTASVVLRKSPIPPYITRTGNTLRTLPQTGYQWYRNGAAIPGADKHIYDMEETGRYQVEAFNEYGCSSMSDVFDVSLLGTEAAAVEGFHCSVYPEPTSGLVNVSVTLPAAGPVLALLTDLSGRVVRRFENQTMAHLHSFAIDLSGFPRGVYFLRVSSTVDVLLRTITKL